MSAQMEIFQPQQPFQPSPLNVWQSGLMLRKYVAEKQRERKRSVKYMDCMLYNCIYNNFYPLAIGLSPEIILYGTRLCQGEEHQGEEHVGE